MNGSTAALAAAGSPPPVHAGPAPALVAVGAAGAAETPARETFYVSLLGAPAIWINGEPVQIRGEATRRVLVHLVLSSPHVIPNHRLIESTWGGSEPESAIEQIRKIISKLRQGLPGGKDLIRTEPGGYRIMLNAQQSDVVLWRDAIRRAHILLQSDGEEAVLEQFRDALDLWRGPALDGLEGHPFANESVSLHEERNAALEAWCQLAVKRLGAPSVIARLRREVTQRPLEERLWDLLMTTLANSGRVLEALDEYNNLCKILSRSLGVRPSPRLQARYRTLGATANNLAPDLFPLLPRVRRPADRTTPQVPDWIKDLLRGQEPNPGYVMDSRWNVLHCNHAMERWFPCMAAENANIMRWALTDPLAPVTLHDWDSHVLVCLGMLKLALAKYPGDPTLSSILRTFKDTHGTSAALIRDAIEVETRENHKYTVNVPHITPAPVQVVSHLLMPAGNPNLRVVMLTPPQGRVIL
ncbi:BTAD domain-containing putative transcriptional regulator [Kitasatospora sp. NPDC094019]|uniref:BTAD domain-containing putative transcriptional regulator n=1 Tax=Kitasatospora sp. NPDC094019 TaxID=3364091 RepID=UPI003812A060